MLIAVGHRGRKAVISKVRWLLAVVAILVSAAPLTANAAGKADLTLSVSGPSTIEQGVRLVYRVAWGNSGPDAATNAKVVVTFPSSALQWDYFDTTCNWSFTTPGDPDSVTCSLGTVPAGTSGFFYFDFYPQTLGTYQVKFVMSSDQSNPSPKDSKVTETVTVVAPYHADLYTDIRENNYLLYPQQPMTFSVLVGNYGPAAGTNVIDSIQFSPGLDFVAAGSDSRCTGSGQTVSCAIGSLGVQESQYLAVNASAEAEGTYIATSTISGDQPDQDTSNNSSSWTVQVQPAQADMTISFPGTYPNELTGRPVPMLVQHDNRGPNDATGVVVQVTFPDGWTPDPTDSDPTCNSTSGTTLICNVGSQAANTQAQLTAAGIPSAPGTYTVSGTISSAVADPYPNNNSASTTVPVVNPTADLSVVVYGPSQVSAGQDAYYTINITNNGPQTASSVVATDSWTTTVKKGVVVVNSYTSNGHTCTVSGPTVTCPIGDMPYGAFQQAVIVLQPLSRGTLVDTGQADSPTQDPNPGNNSGTVTTTVQ